MRFSGAGPQNLPVFRFFFLIYQGQWRVNPRYQDLFPVFIVNKMPEWLRLYYRTPLFKSYIPRFRCLELLKLRPSVFLGNSPLLEGYWRFKTGILFPVKFFGFEILIRPIHHFYTSDPPQTRRCFVPIVPSPSRPPYPSLR